LAVSCAAVDGWEERQAAEFNWDESPYYTARYDIPVTMPCWLAGEDISKVLSAVDIYYDLVCEFFPVMKEVDPSEYTIHIHDSPGAFWAGHGDTGCWAMGWQVGHHIVVSWSWVVDMQFRPNDLAIVDPLGALAHEYLHILFSYERFWADPGHRFYDDYVLGLLAQISFRAPSVDLSEESIKAARGYRYVPWAIGGGPDD
jgi:hypothetical protein